MEFLHRCRLRTPLLGTLLAIPKNRTCRTVNRSDMVSRLWGHIAITAENAPGLTKTLVSVLVGGAVGGAGLGICESIYSKRKVPRGLLLSTLVGCVAALPFWAWITAYLSSLNGGDKSQEQGLLIIAFAI
jgi:hypothetical protein